MEDVVLPMLKKYNYYVKTAFYTPLVCLSLFLEPSGHQYLSGCQLHENCTRVAASRMQISADFIHVACYWRPRRYNLHSTGGHSVTIYMRLTTSSMQTVHALAASCVQAASCFASTLREQLFELKNEDAVKKFENLRNTFAC
jgi:hypothetical protein